MGTIKNLKAKTTYNFRIRTYTVITNPTTGAKETYYGKWSKAKKAKAVK